MNDKIKIEKVENGFIIETDQIMKGSWVSRRRIETRLDRVLKQVEKLFKEK